MNKRLKEFTNFTRVIGGFDDINQQFAQFGKVSFRNFQLWWFFRFGHG
ncbi:hypothetical protein [Alteromonas sp. OM2203]